MPLDTRKETRDRRRERVGEEGYLKDPITLRVYLAEQGPHTIAEGPSFSTMNEGPKTAPKNLLSQACKQFALFFSPSTLGIWPLLSRLEPYQDLHCFSLFFLREAAH